MDNILQLWTDGLKELSQSKFPFHLKVEGEFNSYLVYAVQFVKVQFSIEPAEQLEVIVGDKFQYTSRAYRLSIGPYLASWTF